MSGWSGFLRELDPEGALGIVPMWTMANGSVFFMRVPRAANVRDNALADEHEFPFKLSEIVQLDFRKRIEIGKDAIECDLTRIEAIAKKYKLVVGASDYGLTVRSPEI